MNSLENHFQWFYFLKMYDRYPRGEAYVKSNRFWKEDDKGLFKKETRNIRRVAS